MQGSNKHLHEKLKQLPHLSAVWGRQHHKHTSHFLSKSEAICWLQNKEREREGPVWPMIYSWSQENSSPLKWYFSWALTLQSSSGLGIYVSPLHVFFSGFHYYMTHRSPQSAEQRSQRGCPGSENFAALKLRIEILPHLKNWMVSSPKGSLTHLSSKRP